MSELSRGDYRYGGDCVMVGIGVYQEQTVRGRFSRRRGAPEFSRQLVKLVEVIPLSGLYNYHDLGWDEAHRRAYLEAEATR